jgi:hypothetical protein
MTEAEWLTCDDPKVLWANCDSRATERKKAILRVACCRSAVAVTNQTDLYEFEVSVLEGYADGHLGHDVVHRVFTRLSWPAREAERPYPVPGDPPALFVEEVMIAATAPGGRATESTLAFAQGAIEAVGLGVASARRPLVDLIRDIFGNPFRPVSLDPSWVTSTVATLAQQMYDSRDFSPMPIFADALQDAGCDNPAVLDHCRGDGTHVRGCWVVDSVLGKE